MRISDWSSDVCSSRAAWPLHRPSPATRDRNGASPATCAARPRSEEHTSELQSLMRISYAVFCLKKKRHKLPNYTTLDNTTTQTNTNTNNTTIHPSATYKPYDQTTQINQTY